MENTTAVNVREEAGAFPLPVPPTKHALTARAFLVLLVCSAAAVGMYLIGLVWVVDDIQGRVVLGFVVLFVAFYVLTAVGPLPDMFAGLFRAESLHLALLESLAQQDPEVRLYLRRVYGLGRPILAADVNVVLARKKKIEARAEELDRAECERAIQERLQALVSAPDQSPRPISTPGQEATQTFVDGLRKP